MIEPDKLSPCVQLWPAQLTSRSPGAGNTIAPNINAQICGKEAQHRREIELCWLWHVMIDMKGAAQCILIEKMTKGVKDRTVQ
jgi:hypothetical protein